MRTLLAFAALVLTVAITGCQRAPASGPAPASVPAGPLTGRLKAEGDALMAQQAYDQAAVKYQAALNEAPNDIPIRYALAVALSYLPRREETVEQFRTILYRGDPASFEVKAARDWHMTLAPPFRSLVTTALPIPAVPPVTRTRFPLNSFAIKGNLVAIVIIDQLMF